MFGVAVHVEGAEGLEGFFVIVHAFGAIAVGGGGGGVDEADIIFVGPGGEGFGVFVVILDEVATIFFGSVGAGAEVEDGGDVVEEVGAFGDEFDAGIGFHVVVEL